METRFQTSFIPKKPIVASVDSSMKRRPRRGASLFMMLGVIIFIASLAGAVGAYFWKNIQLSNQVSYKAQLVEREKQFNIDLIEQLRQVNIKIDMAKQLLTNHLATSQIFDVVSKMTSESVRFLSLDMSTPTTKNDGIKLSMRGYGKSFSSVAFQSDVLSQLEQYGLRRIVKNPIISDPSLDSNGTVSFGFTATIDPGSMSYTNSISNANPSANDATSTSQTSGVDSTNNQ